MRHTVNISKLATKSDGIARHYHFLTFDSNHTCASHPRDWVPFLLDIAGRFPESEGFRIDVTTWNDTGVLRTLADHIINCPGAVK